MSRWPDGQNPWSSLDLDFVSQPRNLKQRLGEADPPRIADFDQLRSNHDKPRVRAHIVATLAAFALSLAWLTPRSEAGRNPSIGTSSRSRLLYLDVRWLITNRLILAPIWLLETKKMQSTQQA